MTTFARAACAALFTITAARLGAQDRGAAALGALVDGLGMNARVLVIAAHPDDEDTRLITLLAKGRHAETAYLSLTRGDGGQNLIGNELGEALGAIRTEELLAARRVDGGRQYFGRAFDFGFSKTAEETFQHWPHDAVLGDAVKVVRAFRPHVIIAIWSGTPADGHGHHQASGIIAREAYDAAADTARFPSATFGAAWAVPKFYRSRSYRGAETATLRYNAGRYDPLFGRSYAEVAAESRTQHKSQGQGGLERKGVSIVSLTREASRVNESTPAAQERDLFDGVDTTAVSEFAPDRGTCNKTRTDSVTAAIRAVQQSYDARRPDALVPPLDRLSRAVVGCLLTEGGDALDAKVDAALALATGVAVEAEVPREVIALGDSGTARVTVYNRGARTVYARLGYGDVADLRGSTRVLPDSSVTFAVPLTGARPLSPLVRYGPETPTQPWWLSEPRRGDMFTPTGGVGVEERRDDGFGVPVHVSVDGVTGSGFDVRAPVVFRTADPVRGDVRRPIAAAPAISVTLDRAVEYARANTPLSRTVHVRLRSASVTPRDVAVRLELPTGLTADTTTRRVTLSRYDAQADVAFTVRGTLPPGEHTIRAIAESGGEQFAQGYQLIDYDHIRPLRLYRAATTRLSSVRVTLPPRANVAYVQGVGDNVAPMLQELGIPVTTLDGAALATADLSRFTAVVIGQRAYEANDALLANNARLLAWVRGGGTMVVQSGQTEMQRPGVAPFPIAVAQPTLRVTHPEAPVTIVDAKASILTTPNRITSSDFDGWIQERARYLLRSFDPSYQAPLSMSDPGEPANTGTLLVARYGAGTWVYSTLSFPRQLPAGNPGAARLFVNLLAAKAGARSIQ